MHNKVQCNHFKINNNDNIMQSSGQYKTSKRQLYSYGCKRNLSSCKDNCKAETVLMTKLKPDWNGSIVLETTNVRVGMGVKSGSEKTKKK